MGWPYDSMIKDFYLPMFHEKGEAAIPLIIASTVSRQAFLSAYNDLPPIEDMPEKEKKEMKLYVIQMFPDKTIAEKMECCKIIYTIGTLL